MLLRMKARQPPKLEMSRAPAMASRLDQKALAPCGHPPSLMRADRQRRRHRGDEAAEAFRRQRPDFDLDRGALRRPRRAAAPASAAACRRARRADSRGAVVVVSRSRAPSARSSPLSGMPERCAPTTASATSPSAATGGNGASGGCGDPSAPSGRPVSAWNTRPIEASAASSPAGASSVTPNGVPSGAHRGRHRKPAQIEQVDEIGVGAEPAVELDRVGQHLLDRIDGRHRRQHQRVDLRERCGRARGAVPRAGRTRRTHRRRCGRAPPRMICARHRMHRFGRGRDQRARRDDSAPPPTGLRRAAARLS